ncbi:TIGR02680 family protein [Lacticaseibacillus kribbianus]|uniref:TIGR02680 family protein n=1 Tax=Lacticaseibacillus kribbianus TaxID=2926292 RepID=UPI001CD2792C|nr:TIGR02680 family protein [Lacticaseibacillus kribbianus]
MSKFVLNRMGLVNFWYYPEMVFELSDGHMLLRGHNASGKSVTMQSLLPVLLDGVTSAQRMDSFGSRDRKMADLLLGEYDANHKEEAVGYLWAEYRNGAQYLTTGLGLHARRGGDLTRWFFAVEDGRRIGQELRLTTNDTGDSAAPLPKRALRRAMQTGGRFFEHQHDYAEYVRTHVFGFESVEDFDDAIRLMINLRSPKLNSDFKPEVLEAILTESLPSLKVDNVQASAQTLKQIEAINKNVENNQNELQELKPLMNAYAKYQNAQLAKVVAQTARAQREAKAAQAQVTRLADEQGSLMATMAAAKARLATIEADQQAAFTQRERLEHSAGFDLADEAAKLAAALAKATSQRDALRQRVIKAETKLRSAQAAVAAAVKELDAKQAALATLRQSADDFAAKAGFTAEHVLLVAGEEPESRVAFATVDDRITPYRQHLEAVIELFVTLDELGREVTRLNEALEKANAELDRLKREQFNWQAQYDDELDRLKRLLLTQRDSWTAAVAPEVIGEVQRNMDHLYTAEMPEWSLALRPLHAAFEAAQQALIAERHEQQARKAQAEKEIDRLLVEQAAIRKAPYPVPERLPRVATARQSENGHPLYQLVDFRAAVDETTRDALEGALLTSGVLDALVVTDGRLVWGDQTLSAQPVMFAETLADYLQPDLDEADVLLQSQVENLLQTVQVSGAALGQGELGVATVSLTGDFNIGVLTGHGPAAYQAQFIGASAQARTRQRQIEALQAQIDGLATTVGELNTTIDALNTQHEQIAADREHLPVDDDLSGLNRELLDTDRKMADVRRQQRDLSQRLGQAQANQQASQIKQRRLMSQDALAQTAQAYRDARIALSAYRDTMRDLDAGWRNLATQQQLLAAQRAGASDAAETLESTTRQAQDAEATVTTVTASVTANQQLLDAAGDLAEIRAQITALRQREQALQREQKQQTESYTEADKRLAVTQADLKRAEEAQNDSQRLADLFLGTQAAAVKAAGGDDALAAARQASVPSDEELTTLLDRAGKQFNLHSGVLMDFRPQQVTRPFIESPDWATHSELPEIAAWRTQSNQRMVIEAMIDNLYQLLGALKALLTDQVESDRLAMQRSEEQLFKTIIFESLGNVIRQKITSAEGWVARMNQVLAEQENNSELKLHIAWQIKPRDDFSDATTQEIVRLFRKDARLLTEADTQKLQRFLAAQISDRQKAYAAIDAQPQMPVVLQEALDYRNWFEFHLFFSKAGRERRPLTDKVFNQFSGGEKAVTMYTPLLVAMYSRYQNAGPSAPYIITLDEAFAGIDDRNISELFKTIDRLGFNYVMNSQFLQGEYATVPSLNTYELLHRQGSDLVTAIKTHWNGKQSSMPADGDNDRMEVNDDGNTE